MSSEEIKESLDEWLEDRSDAQVGGDIEKSMGKWKRLSKKRDSDGRENRIFLNTQLNKKVLVIEEDIVGFFSEGGYAFYVSLESDDDGLKEYQSFVAMTDLAYFKKEGYMSDWHLSGLVILPDCMDELCEANFGSTDSLEETRTKLLEFGCVEDKDFTAFMKIHS